ncbi:hypothetical protein M098_4863 [Phocaeicola vulgatus str. 3775 SR(B) 19]|nr:hypothetical protein M098_4863 [Phocaeicola vulgatus str. 3775 SR(B) 19]
MAILILLDGNLKPFVRYPFVIIWQQEGECCPSMGSISFFIPNSRTFSLSGCKAN